ncbi:fungal-specific transcription factor domain-domain-containing protein [Kockovaella imperatae]|uniref:Fungal-specific transcription factor domain-domain-containing protein n=1 Tax=Kockovaella imperatae TaxID=4999 RepID=A0A1Y1UCN3_9TREE|nr:fungal-specific transcription factor domain-domain-containing protein [Kockovaella imperatae]ORX35287.1 fungal-specific transcription factor domain-domain-containing protein [Kockovaella imperatae]
MTIQESLARLSDQMKRMEERLQYIESTGSSRYRTRYEDDEDDGESAEEAAPLSTRSPPPQSEPGQTGSNGIDIVRNDVSTTAKTGGAEYRLTTDESGNITYHGVTALNSGPDVMVSPTLLATQGGGPAVPIPSLAESVSQNQALAPIFQALAASKHISVAPELGDALLSAFHCYEVFEITEHAAFLRDMVLGGPCYSELLLMVLYASASRMIDGLTEEQKLAQGDLFVKLAKAYLWKEMEGPTRITTIQSLLLLSARECALGEVSQGWNHAGLAFRMIQDLGIHHDPESVSGVSNLSLEEQATRDRLFWAAFVWDKALSMALGREPTLPPRPGGDPSVIPDFTNDDEPWTPFFVHPLNCPASLQGYVYPQASRSTVFRLLSRLAVIAHDIMMSLYGTKSRDNVPHVRMAFVNKTQKRLNELWSDIPAHLDPWPEGPSPPPHVFLLL